MIETTTSKQRFATIATPHLDAAFNLARWLTLADRDAELVVKEACTRALRVIDGFHGADGRTWLLSIVHSVAVGWLERNRPQDFAAFASSIASDAIQHETAVRMDEALGDAGRQATSESMPAAMRGALLELPVPHREVLVLREMEELTYREISRVCDAPIGTVMARLATARKLLYLASRPKTWSGTPDSGASE